MKLPTLFVPIILIVFSNHAFSQPSLPDSVRKGLIEREIFALLSEQSFGDALNKFDEYRGIDDVISPALLYREAQVAATISQYSRAKLALLEYFSLVEQEPSKNEFFDEAIDLYASVEPLAQAEEESQKVNDEEIKLLENIRDKFLKELNKPGHLDFTSSITPYLERLNAAREILASKAILDCDKCPLMVKVPTGTFEMGTNESEVDFTSGTIIDNPINYPSRNVRVGSFAISIFEVTAYEFSLFIEESDYTPQLKGLSNLCRDRLGDTNEWVDKTKRADFPATCVTKSDAVSYADWLSEKTGEKYRLPTEAEWEYAARAGTQTPYFSGNLIRCDFANFKECSIANYSNYSAWPVGSTRPNPFGIFDMLGNVEEYVSDCYHSNYINAPKSAISWDTDCEMHSPSNTVGDVVRGGDYLSEYNQVYSTSRSAISNRFTSKVTGTDVLTNTYIFKGIRLVREL